MLLRQACRDGDLDCVRSFHELISRRASEVLGIGLGIKERILLVLASTSSLPTSAIKTLCNILSMDSARHWLYYLKRDGYVVPVGSYVREDGARETLWAITEKGFAYLASLGLAQLPFDAAKGADRSDGGRAPAVVDGHGVVGGARIYVQRVHPRGRYRAVSSRELCGSERCFLDGVSAGVLADAVCRYGEASVEFGVAIELPRDVVEELRRLGLDRVWGQFYIKNGVLYVEVRGRIVCVRDPATGFEYPTWWNLFRSLELGAVAWSLALDAVKTRARPLTEYIRKAS